MKREKLYQWLYDVGNPIVRYRVARDFLCLRDNNTLRKHFEEMRKTTEAQRWLKLLGSSRQIHGSKDSTVENCIAKLVEYGFYKGCPDFDERMFPYIDLLGNLSPHWMNNILAPFLISAGYHSHETVQKWFCSRLSALHRTAVLGEYDIYIPPSEAKTIPKAWRDKRIYKEQFNPMFPAEYSLPTIYDLYALAHFPKENSKTSCMMEDVVSYICDERYQSLPSASVWDKKNRRVYAAGRIFLACYFPHRHLLFLELMARFNIAAKTQWFRSGLEKLEKYRTTKGTYCLPSEYLKERKNSYYLYGGGHMGLGENRRLKSALEIDGTFRMLHIKALLDK